MQEVDSVAALAVITYEDLTRGVDGADPNDPNVIRVNPEPSINGAHFEENILEVDDEDTFDPLADDADEMDEMDEVDETLATPVA